MISRRVKKQLESMGDIESTTIMPERWIEPDRLVDTSTAKVHPAVCHTQAHLSCRGPPRAGCLI